MRMELNLSRIDHPSKLVRLCGVTPDSAYLERCWGPLVGPSVVALVRRTHEMTRLAGGVARIDCQDLGPLLGLHASTAPTRNNPVGRTMQRAHTFRLGVVDLDAGTFALHSQVSLLTTRQFRRLPVWAQEQHYACLDGVIDRLHAAGLDSSMLAGTTVLRPGPMPDQRARHLSGARTRAARQDAPPRLRAVPPTAPAPRPATTHLDRLATPPASRMRPPSASL
jgi:hypothetical protein